MKAAFVTGGTGFLGRHLVEQLVAAEWQVTCLHRPSSNVEPLRALGVKLVEGVMHDAESVSAAMPEAVDAVFHVAANTSSARRDRAAQARDNVEGTRAVVAAALRRHAKKLVHTSSISAWGNAASRVEVIRDDTPMQGATSWISYERTKWQAEQEVRAGIAKGLNATLINPPHIMGRYDTVNWARLIRLTQLGELPGIPPGAGDFVHAADVARAHIAAVDRGHSGENYLLPGVVATFREVVEVVGALSGRPVKANVVPALVLRTLGRINDLRAILTGGSPDITPESVAFVTARMRIDSTKAKDHLGFSTIALRPMVEDSYRWLEAQGHLK